MSPSALGYPNTEATGYVCSCGEHIHFETYVFAHWTDKLHGECTKCGRKAFVCRGNAWPARKRKTDTKRYFEQIYTKRPARFART